MFRTPFIFIFTGLIAVSCSKQKPSTPDARPGPAQESERTGPAPVSVPYSTLATELFVIEFQETMTLNSYLMKISWPTNIGKIAIKYSQGTIASDPVAIKENTFSVPVTGGSPVKLELKSMDPQFDAEPYAIIMRTPPHDFEIRGRLELTANTYWSANRLYFFKSGLIITHGFDFAIEAKTIVIASDASGPKTFQILTTEHSEAHKTLNAKEFTNSHIDFSAQKATGEMRIGMIGIDGQNGPSGRSSEPGENGGNSGDLHVKIIDSSGFSLRVVARAGTNGKGSRGSNGDKRGTDGQPGTLGTFDLGGVRDARVE